MAESPVAQLTESDARDMAMKFALKLETKKTFGWKNTANLIPTVCEKLHQGMPFHNYVKDVEDERIQWTYCANDDGGDYIIQLSQVGSAVTYGPYTFQVVRVDQSDEQTQIDAATTIYTFALNLASNRGYENVVQISVPIFINEHCFSAKHKRIGAIAWFYMIMSTNDADSCKLIYNIRFSICGITYGPFAYQEV